MHQPFKSINKISPAIDALIIRKIQGSTGMMKPLVKYLPACFATCRVVASAGKPHQIAILEWISRQKNTKITTLTLRT